MKQSILKKAVKELKARGNDELNAFIALIETCEYKATNPLLEILKVEGESRSTEILKGLDLEEGMFVSFRGFTGEADDLHEGHVRHTKKNRVGVREVNQWGQVTNWTIEPAQVLTSGPSQLTEEA